MRKNRKVITGILAFSLIFVSTFSAITPNTQAYEGHTAYGQLQPQQLVWWWWVTLNTYNFEITFMTGSHFGLDYIAYYFYDDYWYTGSTWLFDTEEIDIDEYYVGGSLSTIIFEITFTIEHRNIPSQWARFEMTICAIADGSSTYNYVFVEDHIPSATIARCYGIDLDISPDTPVYFSTI